MVSQFIDKKNNRIIERNCKFTIGCRVKVSSYGGCYTHYSSAFNTLKGSIFNFSNLHLDPGHKFEYLESSSESKTDIWIVIGKCLHECGSDVIYLLYNPKTKEGVMISSEDVISASHCCHGINEDNLKFYDKLGENTPTFR